MFFSKSYCISISESFCIFFSAISFSKCYYISPSLGTTFFPAISFFELLYHHLWELLYSIFFSAISFSKSYCTSISGNYILLSNLLLQEILYLHLWQLQCMYSSQQSPSLSVIVSPSLGTIFFSAISFVKSYCISISGKYLLLSNLPSPRAISISRSVFISIINLLLQELLYLHLWELQYILLSNLLLQE
jgi:hypothetical protein